MSVDTGAMITQIYTGLLSIVFAYYFDIYKSDYYITELCL